MTELVTEIEQMIQHYDDGDLMSCLSHFESAVRPIVESMDSWEPQEALDILKEACQQIDDEDWQASIENLEKLKGVLNG
jgi:hypothetical protein